MKIISLLRLLNEAPKRPRSTTSYLLKFSDAQLKEMRTKCHETLHPTIDNILLSRATNR